MESAPDYNKVRAYLAEKMKQARSQSISGGIGILVLGIALCGVSYVIAWYVLKYGLQPFWPHPAWLQAILALGIVGLLFIGNTIGGADDLIEYKLILKPGDEGVLFYVPSSGLLSDTAGIPTGFLSAMTNFLCVGPKTVASSLKNFRRAERIKQMDLNGCAAVITVLLSNESKVPFPKIVGSKGLIRIGRFRKWATFRGFSF